MSEKSLMDAILVAVTKLPGAMFWRNNTGLLFTKRGTAVRASIPGAPDIIGIYKGRFVGFEVKTDKGRQEVSQERFQASCEKAGGIYAVVRSVDDALSVLASIT